MQRFWYGVASCAVPGTAAGVGTAHARWGSLPWSALVEPAIGLAEQGVAVTEQQAYVTRVLDGILASTAGARAVFAPTGRIVGPGDVQRQPDLARTLGRIADAGADDLYRGALADEIVRFFRGGGRAGHGRGPRRVPRDLAAAAARLATAACA